MEVKVKVKDVKKEEKRGKGKKRAEIRPPQVEEGVRNHALYRTVPKDRSCSPERLSHSKGAVDPQCSLR
jgi:hypothetical protein